MERLKAILATPHPKMKNACDGAIEVYPKSEADAVIAGLENEIHNLKRSLIVARHEVAKARGKKSSTKYRSKLIKNLR